MKEHRVSYRYAKALLESAKKEGVVELINNDFKSIKMTFLMSKELRHFAGSPVIQLWRKKKVLNEIFEEEKISPLSMEFLILLIDKRRGDLVLSIIEEFEKLYNILNNRLPITVESAVEMDEKMKEQVLNKVSAKTKMTILPEYKLNEELKGGILVRIQDWVFDASIKNQLKMLRKQLIEGN
ncbi:ATP synthase F1 subunit delta [Bacteroidetes/Chlorobi group bacterium ChocPot_Mid]|jgi:F-type H+-transporting ATPase subunit delta|nr:MAG: ATP synthase F1 subunit delta [Bacteroidetes/Chlorobi group bacterium ChocPot_Mid]